MRYTVELEGQPLAAFPCIQHNRKPCFGSRGVHDATSDPAKIAELFWRYGGTAIAVAMGQVNNIDLFDIDPRHGGHQFFEENAYRIPLTRTHKTPRGGLHLFFRHVPGLSNREIAPGVDIKTTGGYAVWHPANGFPILHEGPIAPWPQWL
jgi:hypothetical protein